MTLPDDALTRAGQILYRELPEEYRYRDNGTDKEPGDLAAYLHGFGHLLDLVRATTEQAYADAFAEPTETGHEIQPWLLPYLAEIVGADLLAPNPARRREELNNSVLWSKSKGTLRNVDQVGDVISGSETVVREGWRLTLTCPRPGLPPFSVPTGWGGAPLPLGCPDLRASDRPVLDAVGANPLFRLRMPGRDADGLRLPVPTEVFWAPRAPGGAPCFPDSCGDGSARCPDLRDVELAARPGPHPGRSMIHIRPPDGFFEPGLRVVEVASAAQLGLASGQDAGLIDPGFVLERIEGIADAPHDRIIVRLTGDLTLPTGSSARFENLRFIGTVAAPGGDRPARVRVGNGARLSLRGCAVQDMILPGTGNEDDPDTPALEAQSSLFGAITGPNRFARLVNCTVMGELDVARLWASDCLFDTLSSNLKCEEATSCIRYSRLTPTGGDQGCFSKQAPTNTHNRPTFVMRYLKDGDTCTLRPPAYGEPGYGVLDIRTHRSISAGAEDEGEMGAYHSLHFAAQARALHKKLSAFLPLGQEISLVYDPLLALTPPRVGPAGGN